MLHVGVPSEVLKFPLMEKLKVFKTEKSVNVKIERQNHPDHVY